LWTLPGAVVATLIWALASFGFTLYVSNFATYDLMYGPLGAVVVLLMWFWVSVYVVLLGAELNVALQAQHASTEA
jgi:membrane protein